MDIVIEWIVRLMVWVSAVGYERWQPGQRLKILLVGYNGARNTGADARVVALVQQLLEEFGEDRIQLTVMALNADNVRGYFPESVNIQPFPTFFCWSLLRAASKHHMALLCEGSTLTHTFADALSMFFCQAAGIMKRQGKLCVAYGSDVTTLHRRLARLSRQMCSDVHFIARSHSANTILQNMGFESHLGTDTAWTFSIPEAKDMGRDIIRSQGWDGQKKLLGVAVINPFCWPVRPSLWRWIKAMVTGNRSLQYDKMYFFSDSKNRRKCYHRYLSQMAEAVNSYQREHDAFVVVLGMEKLDAQACHDLREMIDGDCAVVTSRDTDVFLMTSVIHQLDILLTSRYHASVLSMLKAMPVVAVSMDNRLDGLFRDIGFDKKYLHHVGDRDLAAKISRSFNEAESDKANIVATIKNHTAECREKLKEMSAFLEAKIKSQII